MEKLKDSEGNTIVVFKRYFIPKHEIKEFHKKDINFKTQKK